MRRRFHLRWADSLERHYPARRRGRDISPASMGRTPTTPFLVRARRDIPASVGADLLRLGALRDMGIP